jgi:hypothetical protein
MRCFRNFAKTATGTEMMLDRAENTAFRNDLAIPPPLWRLNLQIRDWS